MGYRSDIVALAQWWADPGEWKPTDEDLVYFFQNAGAEAKPSLKEAQEALKYRVTGVKVGGQVKHWCGVFACSVLREAGLNVARWTLLGGKIKNVSLVWGNSGMRAGDVAMITEGNHHFILTDVDYSAKSMRTVEGNTSGQYIRARTRKTTEPYAYYRIPE
ncbi:MAG: hypothetical protein ACRD68_15495 [Pyrinomonadaceae bacterium]